MSPLLKFTLNLARESGDQVLTTLNKKHHFVSKTVKRDIASEIDFAIEKSVSEKILKKCPGHNIIREETKNINQQSPYTWVIDAIDGSKYFQSGIKFFTTAIGLWYQEKPLLGVVYQPGTKDSWWAEKGHGAYYNHKKIKVSSISKLSDSIIYLDITRLSLLNKKEHKITNERMKRVMEHFYRFRVMGLGSLSLCYLAQGHFDAYFDLTGWQEIKDLGAGLVIAQEAGAKITDLGGQYPGFNARHLLVSNGRIHNQLIKLLK